MRKFVRITGAKVQETWVVFNPLQRISRANCPYPKDAGSGFTLACVAALERAISPPLSLLLAVLCRSWRHFDPVYESMA